MGDSTTPTTTATYAGAKCELWSVFILSILITLGSLGSSNWSTVVVGIMPAIGSGILIFQEEDKDVRKVGFWILVVALVLDAIALVYLISVGVWGLSFYPGGVWGLSFFFVAIFLATAVPVLIMGILILISILKLQPLLFNNNNRKDAKDKAEKTVQLPLLP